MKLELEFKRNDDMAREVLSKVQYAIYVTKAKALMNILKKGFPERENTETGFRIIGEGTEEKVLEQKKRLENFLMGSNFSDADLQREMGKGHWRLFKKKFRSFKQDTLNKALSEICILYRLNSCGIIVEWKTIEQIDNFAMAG